jgi:hypothetical protein
MDRRAVVSTTRPQPPSGESRGGDGRAGIVLAPSVGTQREREQYRVDAKDIFGKSELRGEVDSQRQAHVQKF